MKRTHQAEKIKDTEVLGMPESAKEMVAVGSEKHQGLMNNGVYILTGEINSVCAEDVLGYILEANLNPQCDWEYITMIINSPGGFVSDGFAIIDAMFGSHIPIKTVGIGMIASMGLQIFLAGQEGSRMLTPNCMILSHQFTGGAYGKEHELVAAQTEQHILSDNIMRHYKRTTGMSKDDIRKYLLPPEDVWLTAKDAKKYGICDVIKDLKPKILL